MCVQFAVCFLQNTERVSHVVWLLSRVQLFWTKAKNSSCRSLPAVNHKHGNWCGTDYAPGSCPTADH